MGEARLRVLYRFTGAAGQGGLDVVAARAEGVALEQSVELPRAAVPAAVADAGIVGEVESLDRVGDEAYAAWISYPAANVGASFAQLLNVLFGNTSLQSDVTLADMMLPPALLAEFPGPHFGIGGIRQLLGGASGPLTCTALKPLGLDAATFAALFTRFARAGIHVIKDDHSIADQAYAPFAERVRACAHAAAQVAGESGCPVLYVPHVSGAPTTVHAQTLLARDAGLRMVMVAPMLIGLPAFAELVAAFPDMAFMGHPALGGAWRIAPELLFGKLYRLAGADAVIFVNHGGRFGYTPTQCRALADKLRSRWGGTAASFPVPSGGMSVERVPEIVRFYGPDTLLLVSGDLFGGHPADQGALLDDRSRAFVHAAAVAAQPHLQSSEPDALAPFPGGGNR